jgi:hypothetical protein
MPKPKTASAHRVETRHSNFMLSTHKAVLVPALHEGKMVQFRMPFTMQKSLLEAFTHKYEKCPMCLLEEEVLQPVHRRFNFAT